MLDHLEDFVADLQTKQRAERYIHDLKSRFSAVAEDCAWHYPKDIQPDHFLQWRSQYEAAPKTLNEYLNACNALLNWMVRFGRITTNPLKPIEKIDLRGKQQLRRALTDDELARLLEHAEDYKLLYLSATYTGLRLNELIQLIVADVKLDEERPHLIAQASTTKNGKKAVVPIHPRLVAEFTQAVRGKGVGDRVFPQYTHPDKRFRRHLKAAGIEQIDATGRKLDFHALRYTFATKLARKGVSQRLAQELMRHSDPRLTANIYTDAAHLPTFDAVESLPWHGQPNGEVCPQIGPQNLGRHSHFVAEPVTKDVSVIVSQNPANQYDRRDMTQVDAHSQMVGVTGFEPATSTSRT